MQRKRQFQTAAKRRPFFDRKVTPYGHSHTVALGKIIPKNWQYVRLTVLYEDESTIQLEIHKLLAGDKIAQTSKTNPRCRTDA